MTVYLDVVILLNFVVDFLLLMGTNRLCGQPPGVRRNLVAAAVGGVYAGVCMLPGMMFLGNQFWRILFLALMAWIAFGSNLGAVRRGCVFLLLSLALGGIALGFGKGGIGALIASACMLTGLCAVGFRHRIGGASYVPVELCHEGKKVTLTALEDTGNSLRDPVTGRSVLVVGADIAQRLTGLTEQQLREPVKTVASGKTPGLRLIPFHTVGQTDSLMLALWIKEVRIGNWKGSSLVAFAPVGLDKEGTYQALTGGTA